MTKQELKQLIKKFIKQSFTEDFKYSGYKWDYRWLEIKASFWKWSKAKTTWCAFLWKWQEVTNWIYPVLLFDWKNEKLYISYWVSATEKSKLNWWNNIINKNNIPINKYKESYLEKEIEWVYEDIPDDKLEEIIESLDNVIDVYLEVLWIEEKEKKNDKKEKTYNLEDYYIILKDWIVLDICPLDSNFNEYSIGVNKISIASRIRWFLKNILDILIDKCWYNTNEIQNTLNKNKNFTNFQNTIYYRDIKIWFNYGTDKLWYNLFDLVLQYLDCLSKYIDKFVTNNWDEIDINEIIMLYYKDLLIDKFESSLITSTVVFVEEDIEDKLLEILKAQWDWVLLDDILLMLDSNTPKDKDVIIKKLRKLRRNWKIQSKILWNLILWKISDFYFSQDKKNIEELIIDKIINMFFIRNNISWEIFYIPKK